MMDTAPKPHPPATHPCARCGQPARKGWKYCYLCYLEVREEMEANGYLTPLNFDLDWRGSGRG
jgi:hypothetical protein